MALTEFLLARLVDDAANAQTFHDHACVWIVEHPCDPMFSWQCDCGHPSRLLAEIAAKRAIVDRLSLIENVGPAVDQVRALDMQTGGIAALRDAGALLAAVYADHPDYDESWRL